jgi:hypothetical protein
MKLKRLTQAGLVAATVAAAGLGLALPASASGSQSCSGYKCTLYADPSSNPYYEAQVDNAPAGHASWIWVWSNNAAAPHINYYLKGDGSEHTFKGSSYGAQSTYLTADVTALRVCGYNGGSGDTCSPWAHPLN